MKKLVFAVLVAVSILLLPVSVQAQVFVNTTVDDSLYVSYSFEGLDQSVYEQALSQLAADTIPRLIESKMDQLNMTSFRWSLPPEPLVHDGETRTITSSLILSGSDVVSLSINRTTMARSYTVQTEWRKILVNLTDSFSTDFAQRLAISVAQWQRVNKTDDQGNVHGAFHYENEQEGLFDVAFDLILPVSASNVRVEENTIIYDMPPRLEDQLVNSPFLILGALAIVLVIVLLIRKVR